MDRIEMMVKVNELKKKFGSLDSELFQLLAIMQKRRIVINKEKMQEYLDGCEHIIHRTQDDIYNLRINEKALL